MGKEDFCLKHGCKNKDANQHFCFHFMDSMMPLLLKSGNFKPSFFDCTGQFVLNLVGNLGPVFLRRGTNDFSVCQAPDLKVWRGEWGISHSTGQYPGKGDSIPI